MHLGFDWDFLTFAHGEGVAPLSVHATLSSGCAVQQIARVAGEVDHIVQIELTAVGSAVGGVSRVTASYGCWETETDHFSFDVAGIGCH